MKYEIRSVKFLIFSLFICSVLEGQTEITSKHFVVRYDQGSKETAHMAADAAEKARVMVTNILGIEVPSAVLIQVVSSRGAFGKDQPAQPGEIPGWAAGTAYPSRQLIFIRQPVGADLTYNDIAEVVTHEYTHIAVGYYLNEKEIPRWFEEGVADFISSGRSWSAAATIGIASLSGRLISFEALDSYWPSSQSEADIAYAQAADFVDFIESRYGPGAIRAILEKIQKTGDFNSAVIMVTGKPLQALEYAWLDHVIKKYRWIPLLTGGVGIWMLGSLLVIVGYFRKRRINRLKLQLWEIEEKVGRASYAAERKIEEDNNGEDTGGVPYQ